MSDEKLYDVFLSHNGQDKEAVEDLARRLEDEAQLRPWLDKWNLVPGEPWQEALELALNGSRTCAVFLGPDGVGSWQNEEMRAALQDRVKHSGFRAIPVLLPGALPPDRKQLVVLRKLFSNAEGRQRLFLMRRPERAKQRT